MKTYLVRREWTVVMESTVAVRANSPEKACEIAMDYDYDEQEIVTDSDGPTYVGSIQELKTGTEITVPTNYREAE
jgi:hypothetical protein